MASPVIHHDFIDGTNKGTGGSAYDIQNTGSLTFDTTNKVSGTSSVSLTGSSVNAGDCPQFPFNTGVNGLHTMSFWMKMTETSVLRYLFTTTTSSTDKVHFNSDTLRTYVRPGTTNTVSDIEFVVWSALNDANYLMSYVSPPYNDFSTTGYCDGNWHHFVMVSNNSGTENSYDLYIDNDLAATNMGVNSSNGEDRFMFLGGCAWHAGGSGNNSGITGNVDDFRLYDYALSSSEISSLYNEIAVQFLQPVIHYTFDTDGTNTGRLGSTYDLTIPSLFSIDTSNQLSGSGCLKAIRSDGQDASHDPNTKFSFPDWIVPSIGFSMSFFIKYPDGFPSGNDPRLFDANFTSLNYFSVHHRTSTSMRIFGASSTNSDFTHSLSLFDGNYHNYVLVFSGTNKKLYIDGVLIEDDNTAGGDFSIGPTMNNFNIGSAHTSNAGICNGYMDQISLYDYPLSISNVKYRMFTAGMTITQLASLGISISDLLAAGLSVAELLAAGLSVADLLAAGLSVADLLAGGLSVADLLAGGLSFADLLAGGLSVADLLAAGLSVAELLAGGAIPDWTFDTDANHFAQSYVKDFIDISGSLVLRENSSLTVNGNIETKGNINIKYPIMEADLSLNHNMIVSGDISMNGNVTVGDVSMNGKVLDCSFTDSSIPESAFNGQIGPDYTQPTILYEKGFDTTTDVSMNANVQINNLKVDGNIEFSDGTTMSTYDDNKSYDYDLSLQPGDYFDLTSGSLNLAFAPGDKGEQIFCSSDGRYAAIGIGGGWNNQNSGDGDVNKNGIFITRDFGATWNQTHLPNPTDGSPLYRNHIAFNMSYDGKYMVCGVHASGTGSTGTDTVIGLSTDYGVTWTTYDTNTKLGGTSAHYITSVAVNHDASIITACRSSDNYTQISTDQMATWSNTSMAKEGEFMNSTKIVNNRIFIGAGQVGGYTGYNVDGTSFGNFSAVNASGYRCCGAFPMGGPGSSNTIFFCNSNNGNIRKFTNVDTTPVAVDMSTVNTSAENYNGQGIVMSPSGKYVLIGQNSNWTIRSTLRTENPTYFSNDFGETFSTVSPYLFNVAYFRSIAISDNGYFYGFDGTGKKLYHSNFEKFKASTFTSLDISGNLTAGSFSTSSDYRIKTDISQLDETVTLDNLRPVKYLQTLINKPQYGLIAHELQEYYPDLVVGEKDGNEWQRVNYTGLIALLINEIKQLKRELTELENGM
jgi:hypothetical protein